MSREELKQAVLKMSMNHKNEIWLKSWVLKEFADHYGLAENAVDKIKAELKARTELVICYELDDSGRPIKSIPADELIYYVTKHTRLDVLEALEKHL